LTFSLPQKTNLRARGRLTFDQVADQRSTVLPQAVLTQANKKTARRNNRQAVV